MSDGLRLAVGSPDDGRARAEDLPEESIASGPMRRDVVSKMRITSPIDGVVISRFAHPGETLGIAARLVTIADLHRVRVEAEVDEADLAAIPVGAEAIVSAAGFSGLAWKGRVEEAPDVVVGRHLRPEDTSRPVDTRVLLVKIAPLEPTPVKLGQRVEVRITRPNTQHSMD